MENNKKWLYRVLVLAGAAVLLVSWFLPWWTIDVDGFTSDAVQIRPWGLVWSESWGDFAGLVEGQATLPGFFVPFMWTFLGLCLTAILVGLFVNDVDIKLGKLNFKLSQLLIGGVGAAYLFAGVFAAIYASFRMGDAFGCPLVGRVHIDMGEPMIAFVTTRLLLGYWLIYVAGGALLALGIFQDKIVNALGMED